MAKRLNKEQLEKFFGMDLSGIKFSGRSLPVYSRKERFRLLKEFDIFFHLTDGSLFWPFSRKNLLIIQSPAHLPSQSVFNKV